ncbi:MAG: Tripartite-type tricarboxylate transporter, receptor component TctC [Hyphomicrobiales bacterium]|nr:Tripartite-type tricarboxylate transporter, receptor component TctC [Hyphomicrobiales bacterium]
MVRMRRTAIFALALVAMSSLGTKASADAVEDFFKGKTVRIIVGFSPGGGYDLNARTISRYIGRHIPGKPNVIVQNMPGAGSLTAVNYLANIAPKDGTVIGTFSRGVIFEPLMGNKSAQFDPRALNWIGSPSRETNLVFVRSNTPFNSLTDLRTREMVVATTGGGADTATFPLIMNSILGTKLKVVTGYPGATETLLAVERGEADGMAGLSWGYIKASKPNWIADKTIRILVQLGAKAAPDLPNVPSALDLAANDEDRTLLELFLARLAIAWPLAAPSGVPPERVAALRAAFQATMTDPDYKAEAEKQAIEVDPVRAEEISEILDRVYKSPETVVERARKIAEAAR